MHDCIEDVVSVTQIPQELASSIPISLCLCRSTQLVRYEGRDQGSHWNFCAWHYTERGLTDKMVIRQSVAFNHGVGSLRHKMEQCHLRYLSTSKHYTCGKVNKVHTFFGLLMGR